MSSLLTAELAATCNALGSYDKISDKYLLDEYTLDTVKDLIRYLRRDDKTHEIRRHLGQTRVLETDLVPILIHHSDQGELFDVTLRLAVNLTNPPLLLYREEVPTEKSDHRCYLQITSHLQIYKANAFVESDIWTVLGKRLTKILEMDQFERGEEQGLIIERILILVRNVLHVPPSDEETNRPDNEASVHDQVLWALNQSGLLDIILYMSSESEKQYYMHILEIISLALKEQDPSNLADASLHRSIEEKKRDENELRLIRENEVADKKTKTKVYSANRHSRFGGTYIVQNMKAISDNKLICHKPLSTLNNLDFDLNKTKVKTPKNRRPADDFSNNQRRSAFAVRLFLKEFCTEFINGSYNPLMHHVRDILMRSKAQKNDESYYMWAMNFFMEFNRKHNFDVKFVSETVSVSTFHYIQQKMENCFEMIAGDKKSYNLWVKRLHLSLKAYQQLLFTLSAMDSSSDQSVKDSARVIKSNIFYVLEYREFVLHLMSSYDETKMPKTYLKDLIETAHVFLKMLEHFCKQNSLVVQKKIRAKAKKAKKNAAKAAKTTQEVVDKEHQWDEIAGQLSAVLQSDAQIPTDVVPFDVTLDIPIDEQKGDCTKKIQRLLLDFRFEDAIGLLRAARDVWPENDIFGAAGCPSDEEFSIIRTIFVADIGAESLESTVQKEEEKNEEEDEEEEDEEDEGGAISRIEEADFSVADYVNRIVNPKVVKSCCLLLDQFEKNYSYTNHCVIKIMHRIAWDCKYASMFFQASLFRTFQRILASKSDQHKEMRKFAIFIVRKFTEVATNNPKVFMETLFWKRSQEAYELENGYETHGDKKLKNAAWTEEQENELRVLYAENQSNPATDKDVIDWIQESMIDQSKTRRGIIKKLKELGLIFRAPTKKGAKERAREEFGDEEDEILRKLWDKFKEDEDPIEKIMLRISVERPKRKIIERLQQLGLIRDKSECKKKSSRGKPRANKKKTNLKATDVEIIKSLISAVDGGFNEGLKWIIESLEEVALDQEAEGFNPTSESVPLVPIQEAQINAMENSTFLSAIKCLGLVPPDDQETYWRIPSSIHFNQLRKTCDIIQKAIDGILILPEEQIVVSQPIQDTMQVSDNNGSSSSEEDVDDLFKRISNMGSQNHSTETPNGYDKSNISKRKKIQTKDTSDSDSDNSSMKRNKKSRLRNIDSSASESDNEAMEPHSHNSAFDKLKENELGPSNMEVDENTTEISSLPNKNDVASSSSNDFDNDSRKPENIHSHKSQKRPPKSIRNKNRRRVAAIDSDSDEENVNSSSNFDDLLQGEHNKDTNILTTDKIAKSFLDSSDSENETNKSKDKNDDKTIVESLPKSTNKYPKKKIVATIESDSDDESTNVTKNGEPMNNSSESHNKLSKNSRRILSDSEDSD